MSFKIISTIPIILPFNELNIFIDKKLDEKFDVRLDRKLDDRFGKILKNLPTKDYINEVLDQKLDQKLEGFVTKDYLNEALDQKLEGFATKDYIDERLNKVESRLEFKIDQLNYKIDVSFEALNNRMEEYFFMHPKKMEFRAS